MMFFHYVHLIVTLIMHMEIKIKENILDNYRVRLAKNGQNSVQDYSQRYRR